MSDCEGAAFLIRYTLPVRAQLSIILICTAICAFSGIAYGTSSAISPPFVLRNLYLIGLGKKALVCHVAVSFHSGIQTFTTGE